MGTASKIIANLQRAKNILLLTHIHPDGDTIGCVAAFFHLLNLIDPQKRVSIFSQEKFWESPKYNFLNIEKGSLSDTDIEKQIKNFDLIIACDCGEITRTGIESALPCRTCPLINIDHHRNNSLFGDINLVDEKAAATAEIIFNFLTNNNLPIDKKIAECLLLGIITDTDGLSTITTTRETLKITDELVKSGANLSELNKQLWQDKTHLSLQCWAKIFSRLKINKKYGVAIITVPDELLKELQANEQEIAHDVTEFLNYLADVKMAIILKYDKDNGTIKGSARTTLNSVDVGALANILGGGGHQKASGFSLLGKMLTDDSNTSIK